MLLKRIYTTTAAERAALAAAGKAVPAAELSHIEVKHTGTHPEQNFSRRLVEGAIAEGWMTLSKGKLTLHAKPEDLQYTVKRVPGHYCLHCGEKLESDATGAGARKHVAEKHAGAKSPDPAWPTGYLVTHAYECVLDAKQHAKFKAHVPGRKD